MPAGWIVKPEKIEFDLVKKGDEKAVYFEAFPTENAQSGNFELSIETAQGTFNRGNKIINYEKER